MKLSPWQKFLKFLGFKTLEERIAKVQGEAADDEAQRWQQFYQQRDPFSSELETLQSQDGLYSLGIYHGPGENLLMAQVSPNDFCVHKYIVGTTGTGKTYFIQHLLIQHILRRDGAGIIDVHGDIYLDLCRWVTANIMNRPDPQETLKNIILIDFTDNQCVPGINPLEPIPGISTDRQANQLVLIFRRFYKDRWGVKIEELARFGFMALIEARYTLLELEALFTNPGFREHVLDRVKTEDVKQYFLYQFPADNRYVGSLMNKLRPLLLDQKIRSVIGQTESTINFRDILDQKKIMLVNLNKSYLSANADIMAAIFVGWIQSAALSRRDIPAQKRQPFFLYVDEFQNFANDQFEEILSESRKYGLYLTMAHQSITQLSPQLKHITLGNTDIHCFFRTEAGDADVLAKGAFDVRGGIEKPMRTPLDVNIEYYSDAQELKLYSVEMGSLPNRFFFYRHKGKPYKARKLYSLDVIPACQAIRMDPSEFDAIHLDVMRSIKTTYTKSVHEITEEIGSRLKLYSRSPLPKHKTKSQRLHPIQDVIPDIADIEN